MLPGVYTPKFSSSTPFSYKKHLKTSHLGSIRKNHFKIPHILQKAGSQLKIFLHVPLREISISFRGRNGVLEEDFFLCTPQHSPTNITTLLCPIRSTICCPQLTLLSLLHTTDAAILLYTTDATIYSCPHSPRKNRTGHLHHIRCKRPGPYIS